MNNITSYNSSYKSITYTGSDLNKVDSIKNSKVKKDEDKITTII